MKPEGAGQGKTKKMHYVVKDKYIERERETRPLKKSFKEKMWTLPHAKENQNEYAKEDTELRKQKVMK